MLFKLKYMWIIKKELKCNSCNHKQNTNSKRRILEGQEIYVAIINGKIDKLCCSKCDIRECYKNNLAEVEKVLQGKITNFENKDSNEKKFEVEREWELERDKKDQKEL